MEMPLVMYLGSANSYTVKGTTFFKEKPTTDVEGDVWAYLQTLRDDAGNRLFTEVDPPAVTPRVVAHDVLDKHQVGQFKSKEEALAYSYEVHGVSLDPNLNRDVLNEQTTELWKRLQRGWKGKKLVEGMRGAVIADHTEVVQSIAPPEPPKPMDLNEDGELDTASTEAPSDLMNTLEDNAEALAALTDRAEELKEALSEVNDDVEETFFEENTDKGKPEAPSEKTEEKAPEEMKKVTIKRPPPKPEDIVEVE
jgi:hypothetical protein